MDFNFTAEQEMLRDSVARYFGDHYAFPQRQAVIRSAGGWRPGFWRGLADDVGILGAPFDEAMGGLGGGAVESMIVMEEIGKALVIEPYLDTVVIGGGLLRRCGTRRASELIGGIIAGEVRLAFAHLEPSSRFDLANVSTSAVQDGGTWRISGLKDAVRSAPFATHLLVNARVSGKSGDRAGLSTFLVAAGASGLSSREYPTVDGSRAADLKFEGAPAELLGPAAQGLDALEAAVDEGVVALCAEAVGVMRRLLADTVEYTKQRRQFDAPIAANQALQHRMVDMYMALEQSISMTYMATLKLDRPALERKRAVSLAKVQVGKAAKFVGQSAIQLHGGMGMTNELAISHYFKRATMIESELG
ncbi:MAG: acyl-CoA dehydrogenase family protein, partial [Gammaproteobacteria bacterium]|nr:acyl-CoA dehydrogenase family protein [Gammaproteobacteria bacterium]